MFCFHFVFLFFFLCLFFFHFVFLFLFVCLFFFSLFLCRLLFIIHTCSYFYFSVPFHLFIMLVYSFCFSRPLAFDCHYLTYDAYVVPPESRTACSSGMPRTALPSCRPLRVKTRRLMKPTWVRILCGFFSASLLRKRGDTTAGMDACRETLLRVFCVFLRFFAAI